MTADAKIEIRIWNKAGSLPEDLPEALSEHVSHIADLLKQGFLAGQVVDERFDGWWEIIR